MDVSDGLSLDLSRLCAASGCGAEVRLAAVPLAPAARELAQKHADSRSPLDYALGDGEDFELILAVPPAEARRLCDEQPLGNVRLTSIGQFVADSGLRSIADDGTRRRLEPRGFQH
jgi:thiamine-monophosphate kinase